MTRPLTLLITTLLCASLAHAAVPDRMHYQGYLTNADGEAVHCPDAVTCPDQDFDVTFRLYDQAESGDPLWAETHEGVSVVRGTFDVALGSVSPLDPGKLMDPAWLGVEINGAGEMSPRQRLVSSAFAIRAGSTETADVASLADDAARLGGLDAADYAKVADLAGLCVTDAELTEVLVQASYFDAVDVAIYLTENGYVAGAHFSGQWSDLQGVPAALQQLTVHTDGSLTFGDTVIINTSGEWVGSPTGLQGPPGQTSLVVASQEGASEACPHGGARINSGFDVDDSGSLDAAEVSSTSVVCNGPKGDEGAPAAQALLATAELPIGDAACAHGGVRVNTGLDTDGDETLGATEVTSISAVCHGAPGETGQTGETGLPGVGVASAEVNAAGELVVTMTDNTLYQSDSLIGPKGADGLLAQAGCASGELLQYDGAAWACVAHAGDPDAHHSSTSQGLAISPSSVTLDGTATTLTDGKLDLGAEANDELTAAMVQTLTTGGAADALHSHASAGGGGGGGGCYTAWGTTQCATGFTSAYGGVALSHVALKRWSAYSTYYSNAAGGVAGPICVASTGVEQSGNGPSSERASVSFGTDRRFVPVGDGDLTCALCCPTGN